MFGKVMMGAAAVLVAALFAYLGDRVIIAYGEARYRSGLAEGQIRQVPGILEANGKVAQAGLDAKDRVIAANGAYDARLARLIPQILSTEAEVTRYAATIAGRADCLGPDRVRGIEADRAALFPGASANPAGGGGAGPMPADAAADSGGS